MLINNFNVFVIVLLSPISKDLWGGARTTQRNVFHHDFSNVLQTYFKNMKAGVCLAFCIIRGERYGRNCVSRIGTGHCWQSAAAKWWKKSSILCSFYAPLWKKIFLSQFLICSHYTLDRTLEKNPSSALIGKCWEASFLKRKRWETSFVGRKKLGSQSCSKEKMGSQFRSRKKMTSQFCRRKKKIMFLRKDVNLTTCSIVSESWDCNFSKNLKSDFPEKRLLFL